MLQPHEEQDSTIAMSAFLVFAAVVALDILVAFVCHNAATQFRRGSEGARFSAKLPQERSCEKRTLNVAAQERNLRRPSKVPISSL